MIVLNGPLTELEAMVKERGAGAYVVTVSAEGHPHVTFSPVAWDGGRFAAEVGARTALNARANPAVTLLYPVRTPGDYSLIVDGAATVDEGGQRLVLAPTRAVLHRPGAPADPTSSCTADCVPLLTAAPPAPRPA